jgi:hypothetical protein
MGGGGRRRRSGRRRRGRNTVLRVVVTMALRVTRGARATQRTGRYLGVG